MGLVAVLLGEDGIHHRADHGLEHPLAATLMRRAMVLNTLAGAKSKRYRYAARHLAECQSCDAVIEDYGDLAPHTELLEMLKQERGRKHGF